jgi:lysophospholipase L1-like esterase
MKKLFSLLLAAVFSAGLLLAGEPVTLAANDPAIRYVGRFSDDVRFGWTGSQIETIFTGSELSAVLEITSGQKAGVTAVVDGEEKRIVVTAGQKIYPLISGLDPGKPHHLVLFKRSEGSIGELRFGGFIASKDGEFSAPPSRPHKMLVIGDSITCGYANEAAGPKEGNTVENENGYMSYAAIAARELQADLMMVCWSGRGLYRNRNVGDDTTGVLPSLFEQTLPKSAVPAWDHSRFVPDVIAINLGTNDMNTEKGQKEPLKKEDYIGAGVAFIQHLRALYPGVKIILSIGPMEFEPVQSWLPEIAAQFEGVSVLVYPKYAGPDEYAGHWHPSVKKDREMAAQLILRVRELTGWQAL